MEGQEAAMTATNKAAQHRYQAHVVRISQQRHRRTITGRQVPPAGSTANQQAPPAGTMIGWQMLPACVTAGYRALPAGSTAGLQALSAGTVVGSQETPAGTTAGRQVLPAGMKATAAKQQETRNPADMLSRSLMLTDRSVHTCASASCRCL